MNLILTVLTDVVTSLRITTWLQVMSVIIVLMLLSSPGAVATVIAVGTKLGLFTHVREQKKAKAEGEDHSA